MIYFLSLILSFAHAEESCEERRRDEFQSFEIALTLCDKYRRALEISYGSGLHFDSCAVKFLEAKEGFAKKEYYATKLAPLDSEKSSP